MHDTAATLPQHRLQSYGYLRAIDAEQMRVTAVISTGDLARDDAIVDPRGWVFDNYNRNPVVLWSHDDAAMPMARTIDLQATDREVIGVAEFDRDDPQAVTLFGKVRRGFINATSVRWLPLEAEFREVAGRSVLVFTRQELLEWSFVTIPADPSAVILRADTGTPIDPRAYRAAPPPPLQEPAPAPPASLRAAELIARLHELDPEDARALYERLGALVTAVALPPPPPVPVPPAPAPLTPEPAVQVAELFARYLARRREEPDVEGMVVAALARATGRTEATIRAQLAAAR